MTTVTSYTPPNDMSPADHLAMRSLFPGGALSFVELSEVVKTSTDAPKDPRYEACLDQIKMLDGVAVERLSENQRLLLEKSLQTVLDLPVTPSVQEFCGARQADVQEAERALYRLSLLRGGQPDPQLMLDTSPLAKQALDYLRQEVESQRAVVRLIVGDMGEGKSTFATAFEAHCTSPNTCFQRTAIPRGKRFDVFSMARGVIIPVQVMSLAFHRLALAALIDPDSEMITDCRRAFTIQPLAGLMHDLLDYIVANAARYANEEKSVEIAEKAVAAITTWFQRPSDSRMTTIQVFHKTIHPSFRFTGKPSPSEVASIVKDFLTFYRASQVHPVWLYDEFESITQMSREELDIAVGFFRDLIDLVSETKAGSVVFFSTSDGQRAIRQYTALNDRLKSTDCWSLTEPTWHVRRFSEWDADAFLEALLNIYEQASHIDKVFAGAVAEKAQLYRDLADTESFRNSIQDNDILPRERIKALVSLLDSAVDGDDIVRQRFEQIWPTPSLSDDGITSFDGDSPLHFDTNDRNDVGGDALSEASIPSEEAFLKWLSDGATVDAPLCQEATGRSEDDAAWEAFLHNEANPLEDSEVLSDLVDSEGEGKTIQTVTKPRPLTKIEQLDLSLGGPSDGLTKIGYERQRHRAREAQAVCAWVEDDFPLSKRLPAKSMASFLFGTNSRAHIGVRVASLRDAGGSADEMAKEFAAANSSRLTFLDESNAEHHGLLRSFEDHLNQLLKNHPTLTVMVVGSLQDCMKKRLEAEDDHASIIAQRRKLGHNAYLDVVPYESRFPYAHQAITITPMSDIKTLRKFVYTYAATANVMPPDEWVDNFVLTLVGKEFDHSPRTSRNGIQFIQRRGGLLGMFDTRRTLAVISLSKNITS